MTDSGARYIAEDIKMVAKAIIIAAAIRQGYWRAPVDIRKLLEDA